MESPLVDDRFLLKKIEEKGGWTFIEMPNVSPKTGKPFGWVTVRGTIDGFEIKQYKLWPMTKNGLLFMPVKAEIRKAIGKKVGDWVQITLWPDDSPLEVPVDLLACLLDAPAAHRFWETLTDSNKKFFIDWIFSAKREETRVNRTAKTIEMLENGRKMYEPKQAED